MRQSTDPVRGGEMSITVEKVNMTSPAAFRRRMHLQQMLYHFQQYVVPTSSFAFSSLEFHTLNFESVIRIQNYNKSRYKKIHLLKGLNENCLYVLQTAAIAQGRSKIVRMNKLLHLVVGRQAFKIL